MRYLSLILVLLFGGVLPLQAQQNPYVLPIREHVFDNGLRLLVLNRPGDHRVACKIFTDFGAFVEEPGELGAAHYLEHLMFKGTPTLGTTNWEAERTLIEQIRATEHALIAERNQARNALRQRGVFHDYRHADSTPTLDSLTAELTRLDQEVARYRDNGAMMRWYQAFGGTRLTATTEQEYMKVRHQPAGPKRGTLPACRSRSDAQQYLPRVRPGTDDPGRTTLRRPEPSEYAVLRGPQCNGRDHSPGFLARGLSGPAGAFEQKPTVSNLIPPFPPRYICIRWAWRCPSFGIPA